MTVKNCFQLLAILLISTIIACKNGPEATAEATDDGNLEEFGDFYQKFMRDSAYQLAHIQFPLEGLPDGADSATIANHNFRWQKEDWKIHKPFGEESGFVQQFSVLGNGVVTENIVHRSQQYAMVRRFAKQDGEWYLIYYAGVNVLRK